MKNESTVLEACVWLTEDTTSIAYLKVYKGPPCVTKKGILHAGSATSNSVSTTKTTSTTTSTGVCSFLSCSRFLNFEFKCCCCCCCYCYYYFLLLLLLQLLLLLLLVFYYHHLCYYMRHVCFCFFNFY